ncbi:MAG: rod shape-determining protein MreC [Saprospiraceae bacterium]|nr:rod shape-determining protein MreC [Saprospiraceae bacterium]
MGIISLFFRQYANVVIFILLEAFCFYLIVQYNNRQKTILFNSYSYIFGNMYERYAGIISFTRQAEVADSLAKENANLLEEMLSLRNSIALRSDTIKDDSLKQTYELIEARVVDNSINRDKNFILINKGEKHGITPNSGIITQNGAVGIVRQVGMNYSIAMSVLHRSAIVNVNIKNKGYFGPLVWKGGAPTKMYLEDIPMHARFAKGDTIQTTGYSTIFPSGITLGQIDTFWRADGSYAYTIIVNLVEDLAKLDRVYVVNHLYKDEISSLEKSVKNE